MAIKSETAQLFAAGQTYRGQQVEVQDDGSGLVRGVKIFRTGTFRDSRGDQYNWEPLHLLQMVGNFEMLREEGIFPDVPVRRDHSFSVNQVQGYFEALRVDGEFLVSDLRITEPEDVAKWQRGTYRNVSAEIGMYVTNDEAAYWPVLMGVAAVDIPAVEGLHSKSNADSKITLYSRVTEEKTVTTENETTDANDKGATAPPLATPVSFRVNGAETTDFAAVQAHVVKLENDVVSFAARIEAFETADTERAAQFKTDFVNSLVNDGKIVEAQREALETSIAAMNDDAFEATQKVYEAAPRVTILEKHGDATSNEDGLTNQSEPSELETAQEIVKQHRRAGMSEDFIKKTSAFKRMTELETKS